MNTQHIDLFGVKCKRGEQIPAGMINLAMQFASWNAEREREESEIAEKMEVRVNLMKFLAMWSFSSKKVPFTQS